MERPFLLLVASTRRPSRRFCGLLHVSCSGTSSSTAVTHKNALTANRTAMHAELPQDFYNHKLDRMDPELAMALREGVMSTAASFGLDPAEDLEDPRGFGNVSAFVK